MDKNISQSNNSATIWQKCQNKKKINIHKN